MARVTRKQRKAALATTIKANAGQGTSTLNLACDVRIRAAAEGAGGGNATAQPTFEMTVYSGAPIRQGFSIHPIVIDLAGMHITQKVAMLLDHRTPIGFTESVGVVANQLVASGKMMASMEETARVVAAAKEGFPWQASVGADIIRHEFIKPGEQTEVNSRTLNGPLIVARETALRECSLVTLGADRNTSTRIAATDPSLPASPPAPPPVAPQAPAPAPPAGPAFNGVSASLGIDDLVARAEQSAQRHSAIRASTEQFLLERPQLAQDVKRLAEAAIQAEWTPQQFNAELAKLRFASPGISSSRGADGDLNPRAVEAALCMTEGLQGVDKSYDEQTLEAASRLGRGFGLRDALMVYARRGGFRGDSCRSEGAMRDMLQAAFQPDIQAGFSTTSIGGILSNVANKFLLQAFTAVDASWEAIAAVGSARDFKTTTSYRLTGDDTYVRITNGGEIPMGQLGEETYSNKVNYYGRRFALTREDIINDDLGALTNIPMKLGRGGARALNKEFWTQFLNNTSFFSSGNNNYAEGATTALGIDSLSQAYTLFKSQLDTDGNPLDIEPGLLVVPQALAPIAMQLMSSVELREDGNSSKSKFGTRNIWANRFTVVSSPWMQNAGITGNSATKWYLLASPSDLPTIEVKFLNGVRTPTVQTAEADFKELGIQMRGYFDFGVAKQDFRGGVAMKGTA